MLDSIDFTPENVGEYASKYAIAYYLGGSGYAGGTPQDFSNTEFPNGSLPIYVPTYEDVPSAVADSINSKVKGSNVVLDVEVGANNIPAWSNFLGELRAHLDNKRMILYTPLTYIPSYASGVFVPDGVWIPYWTIVSQEQITQLLSAINLPNPHNINGFNQTEWDQLGQRAWQLCNDNNLTNFSIPVDISVVDSEMLNFGETVYIVQPGDTLYAISQKLKVSLPTLLSKNLAMLDSVARTHGFVNSQNGRWIFPGEKLVV